MLRHVHVRARTHSFPVSGSFSGYGKEKRSAVSTEWQRSWEVKKRVNVAEEGQVPEIWSLPTVFVIRRLRLTVVSRAMRYGAETRLTDTVSFTDMTAESQGKEQTSSSDERALKEEPSSANSDEYFIGSGSSVPTLINIRVVT